MTDRPERPSDAALRQAIDTARTYATGGTTHWLPCSCLDCAIRLIADTLESELTARTAETALREIGDAWAQYQRRDISQEELEGFVAERVELGVARTAETDEQAAERDRADKMRAALERIADRNCWNPVETAEHALKMDDYRLADIAKARGGEGG